MIQYEVNPFTGKFDAIDVAVSLSSFAVANAEAFALEAGTPITSDGRRGSSTSQGRAFIAGLVVVGAGATLPLAAQAGGLVELDAAVWDARTGQVGGLTAGATYFLDADGGLTHTAPDASGLCLVAIGQALTSTALIVEISQPEIL